jgi:hypothetical protein
MSMEVRSEVHVVFFCQLAPVGFAMEFIMMHMLYVVKFLPGQFGGPV